MDDNPDLRHLLDGPGPPAPAEDLRAIVKRAGRRSARWGASAGVVLLAAGGLGGYLISNHSSSAKSVVATAGSPSVPTPAGAGGSPTSGAASAIAQVPGTGTSGSVEWIGGTFTHVLTRTTSAGVTVRIFEPPSASSVVQTRLVEVSTPNMVGTMTTGVGEGSTSGPVSEVLGTSEGAPVIVVAAFTPATVTKVSWSGEGAGDSMAPASSFVALAVPVTTTPADSAAIGTLTFTDAAGHAVQTDHVTLNDGITGCLRATPASASSATPNSSSSVTCSGTVCAAAGRAATANSGSTGFGNSGATTGNSGSGTTGNSGATPATSVGGPSTAPTVALPPCSGVPPVSVHCSESSTGEVCSGSSSGSSSISSSGSASGSAGSVVPPAQSTPRSSSSAAG